jgi:hypothetical protein
MPQMTLPGVVLGLRSRPYDFKNEQSGERVAGVAHRLFLWDTKAKEPVEVKVPAELLGLVGTLEEGQLVELNVEPRASGNKVTYQFDSVEQVVAQYFALTGELVGSGK